MGQNYERLFQNWEIAIAKKLVNEFQEKWSCLKREDFDDLLQECLTHWFFAKDEYDSARDASQETFMGRVVRNKFTDLVREKEADKRKIAHHTGYLDKAAGNDGESPTVLDMVDAGAITGATFTNFEKIALWKDLSAALKKLTPRQQKLCLLIKDGFTVTEASDLLKIHRSTIYDEIRRIRTIFRKEGLKDYLN